jgi:hypothetical protein
MNILRIIIAIFTYLPEVINVGLKIYKKIKEDPSLKTPTRKELLETIDKASSFEDIKKMLQVEK